MAYRDSNSARQTSGSSLTVTAPSVQNNDIIVYFAVAYLSTGANVFTWPTGFSGGVTGNEWYSRDQTGCGYRAGLAWKRASGESGDYIVSSTDAHEIHGIVATYSGRIAGSGVDPLDVGSDTEYQTSDVNVRAAGVTIATAGSDLLVFGYGDYSLSHVPEGMNSREILEGAPWASLWLADLENQGTGSTGNKDAHLDDVVQYEKHSFMVALKPAVSYRFSSRLRCHG